MNGLIARKIGMTRVFGENDVLVPVTIVEAGPCVVLDVKNKERDGYAALQIGFSKKKAKNVSKAVKGHCRKAGKESDPPAVIKEIRLPEESDVEIGKELKVDVFSEEGYLDVIGSVKGRGFQGVVKRYNFGGGRYSHGGGWKRKPGSVGQCEFPGRIAKGKKMPGRMGNVRRTVQNLKIIRVDAERNLLFVKGALPGPNQGVIIVKDAKKKTVTKS